MIPLYLLLENFMSHARSELDFTRFDLALVVGMENDDPDTSNGIGKTALFDAIRWVLYGKCRFRIKKRVIKRGKDTCSVTFVFQLDDDTYKVIRKMSQRAASSEVSLLIKEGTGWRDLSCDTTTQTGEKIEGLIKLGHDTFVNSRYFKQNEILQFVSATASQKKDTLKESLNIEIWDKYQEKAKEISRRLSVQIVSLDDRIKSFGNLDSEKTSIDAAMKGLETKISETKEGISRKSQKLEEIRAKMPSILPSSETVESRMAEIMSRAATIKGRKKTIVDKISGFRKDLEKTKVDLDSAEKRLSECVHDVLVVSGHPEREKAEDIFRRLTTARKLPSLVVFCDKLSHDKDELDRHKRSRDDAILQLNQLIALEPGKKCPTCLSILEDLDKVIRERKKRIKFLENTKRESEILANELMKTVSRQERILAKANASASLLDHLDTTVLQMKRQIEQLTSWCSALEKELEKLVQEWQDLKTKKALIQESTDDGGRTKVLELEKELENDRQSLVKMSVEYGNFQGHSEDLGRRISERNTLLAQRPALVKELDIHNQLAKAFGKAGIPAIIMENVTDDLRKYANDMLRRISDKPMSVDFITQKRTESGSWSETFDIMVSMDDETLEFEDLSGGEQVRVAIAVRLALSGVLMKRMGSSMRFLLLDEVDQALDRRGVQALADALLVLSKEFKILVITHNDAMKERFDHVITVQKGPIGSFLRQ